MNIVNYLKSFSDKKIYYWPNPGNAGDALIAHATFVIFDSLNLNYEIITDTSDLNDEIIIFAGGGNLVEGKYDHMYQELLKSVSNNKCIILPHTIFGFKDLMHYTKNNLVIFCREKISYQMCLLNNANPDNVHLTDDMALQLPENYFDQFKQKGKSRAYCLRDDCESLRIINFNSCNIDISKSWNGQLWGNKKLAKYATFSLASYLSPFEEIETDRLHVAILAGLIGKKVIFYPNNYYKNRAIFEMSLSKSMFNVTFVNLSTELPYNPSFEKIDLTEKTNVIEEINVAKKGIVRRVSHNVRDLVRYLRKIIFK